MVDLKNELNEQQYQAAAHVDGPLLVIAGAGSGKTRVITYRIANLIRNHGVAPWRIMAVTFTNKAAKEMAERVEKLLGSGANCWISTFHSSCARFLRKYGDQAGVDPQFTIYDDGDQKAMVTRVLKELNLTTKQFPPRSIQSEINKAKRELISPAEYPETDFYRRNIRQMYELYEKRMRDAKALDFGDLIYRTVRAMQDNKDLAREMAGQFDHILVDEFQDTNRVQLELVRLLTPHKNICVVGDDDQSIYSWRGADVTNILDFEKIFPGARVVTLDRNYRSSDNILKAAHAVVSQLPGRRPKELWTSAPAGDPIGLMVAPDEREEARMVAREVKSLVDKGFSLNEQVVFYRTNAQSRVFEEVMRAMNIPHRLVGGMRFYERAEIKDFIAYLRLIQNPADHTAFMRVVNVPARGIGKSTLDKLVALAAGHGISAFDAVDVAQRELGGAPAKKLLAFKQMVEQWRLELDEGPLHLINRVVKDTGYVVGLERENTAEADARIENVNELIGSVEDFEGDAETPSLSNFLEIVALQTDVDAAKYDEEQLTLMTVHAAKGLEFDVVLVTGLEEGLFPLIRQTDMGLEETDELDEERRLGYVAMTRARKKLILTRAASRRLFGTSRSNPPSRFIANVPIALVKHLAGGAPPVRLIQSASRGRMGRTGIASAPRPSAFGSRPNTPVQMGLQQSSYGSFGNSQPAFKKTASKPRNPNEEWVDTSFDQSAPQTMNAFPGQDVSHPRFGKGKILGVHPGANPKADIQFPGFGRKTILLKYLEF
ncbi:MAG: UvrD-helicase domain-containing protein [Deltaproteobacteria bacterium]|nr:UvrD-helicase domain-containing protein [Deltaproteobacteria bacterium]MBN2673177.1 UvrD-helicase domain-containing protein [Deltaproteobacteria bacterium]